jgi:hypothetical protein
MLLWQFADSAPEDAEASQDGYATTSVYGFSHSTYYANVLRALKGEEKALTGGREGLRSLELLIAIYKSARDGSRVSLPLDY